MTEVEAEEWINFTISVDFQDRKMQQKFSKLPFSFWILGQDKTSKEFRKRQDKKHYPGQETIVVVVINGNQGSYEQFPLIGNSLDKYLNHYQ